MKLLNTAIFLLISSLYGIAQTNLKEMELKGHVKSLTETPYEIIYKNGEISKGAKIKEFFYDNFNIKFNSKGNKVSETEYNTKVKYIYKYDNIYNQEKLHLKKYYNRFHKLILTKKFIYNERGKLTKRIGGYILSYSTYKYNDQGNLIEFIGYENENIIDGKITYTYDIHNLLIESKSYFDNETYVFRTELTYDDKNRLIKKEIFNSKNKIDSKKVYLNGHCTSHTSYSYDQKFIMDDSTTYNYSYQFDDIGNWIQRTTVRNDLPDHISLRKIKYYK